MKRLATGSWLAFAAVQVLLSCQFPNYNLLTNGQGGSDAGAPPGGSGGASAAAGVGASSGAGAGAGGTRPLPLCGDGEVCQPQAPGGWLGPIAYWEGEGGSELPDCPSGYGDPTDLHAEPSGAPADCSCQCTPTEQECGTTDSVTIFNDLGCANECAHAGTQACTSISGCTGASNSIRGLVTQPTGSCTPKVTKKVGTISWERDARLCEVERAGDDCGESSCFPTPTAPFASQLCVYRVMLAGQRPPTCPEDYPNGPELLYTKFVDRRGCGECECTKLIGGRCDGEVTMGDMPGCSGSTTYKLEDNCKQIPSPKFLGVEYELTPGTCDVKSEPEPLGEAEPSGNYHAVCCY